MNGTSAADPSLINAFAAYLAPRVRMTSTEIAYHIKCFLDVELSLATDTSRESDLAKLKELLSVKVERNQGGVPTYLDNFILSLICDKDNGQCTNFDLITKNFPQLTRSASERFRSWEERKRDIAFLTHQPLAGTQMDPRSLILSQGVSEVTTWRRRPLFKCHVDLIIYAMLLEELKPDFVIEFGSGSGASALMMHDLAKRDGKGAVIHSIDVEEVVPTGISNVHFHRADWREWLNKFERPKGGQPALFIEDFHEDTIAFMEAMNDAMRPGDYLIIEDSMSKQLELEFSLPKSNLRVDTRFTDFFGVNCTSAVNSVFIMS